MTEEKKSRKASRDERKKHALEVVLDENREPEHFWDALLISNIDNVIDSIEWMDSSIQGVEMTIENASKDADKLSRRIFWLNIILIVIGSLGLFIAGYEVFCN